MAQSDTSYEADALPPSHHGWILRSLIHKAFFICGILYWCFSLQLFSIEYRIHKLQTYYGVNHLIDFKSNQIILSQARQV